jgi:hypothetical protein
MRWNISRTSWVLPSPTTTRQNEFMPLGVVRTWATSLGTTRCPSSSVPRSTRSTSLESGTPFTLAMYSRSTPYLGWATRSASSPSLVSSTSPSE